MSKPFQNAIVVVVSRNCVASQGCTRFTYLWRPWMSYFALLKQSFKGPPPRFMIANLVEIANLLQRSMLTDMPSINHDIGNKISAYIPSGHRFMIILLTVEGLQ
ncbi:hypothetical protein SUGI_0217010 [Cryptomeria japonica]|nr:hypothetical protein SUGI_0217010 [Cryptomeria japonica]